MNNMDWYEVVTGSSLLQGDILLRCPLVSLFEQLPWPIVADVKPAIEVAFRDVVVMTQSCDLENDKIEDVLLAQLESWPQLVHDEIQSGNSFIRSVQFRRILIAGNAPGLSLLHKRSVEPTLDWSVVVFRHLYTLPKSFLQHYVSSLGPRLRLRSPYREHLAQAFARYFMRVGLPHDARVFETEGDVKP